MLKITVIVGLLFGGIALAQTEAPANPHKSRDAKMHECKTQADQQQLSGDERRVFIANCMQKPAK